VFGIGSPELFVIIIIALLFVGPDKLPQVAKTVGTGLRDLRRMANLTQTELQSAMNDLAREVERVPEAKAKAELNDKLSSLGPLAPDDNLDKPAPTTPVIAPPVDGETIAVVPKRSPPPLAEQRKPGPPEPHYIVKPADGARPRAGDWAVHPDAAAESPAPTDIPPPEDVPPA
jgi:sec-independent protein translocase protein TatB